MIDTFLAILRDEAWNGLLAIITILGLAAALIRAAFRSRPRFTLLARVFAWIRSNPTHTLRGAFTIAAVVFALLITRSYLAPALLGAYAVSLVLAARIAEFLAGRRTPKYQALSLEPIVNATLHEIYLHPPGSIVCGAVRFQLSDSRYDTSRTRDSTRASIPLSRPLSRVVAVHILANAGGAKAEFRGRLIGQVRFYLDNGIMLTEDLVLGANIREWAIGNASPGLLVTHADDEAGLHQVWAGKNLSGNDAVIDCLTISLNIQPSPAKLERIEFIRDCGPGTSNPHIGFFVSGIVVESN